jgi:hypothetical protein
MEQALARLAKKYGLNAIVGYLVEKFGPAEVADAAGHSCERLAKERGKFSKKYRHRVWKDASHDSACRLRRAAREYRRTSGALRRDEPDSRPVEG